MVDLLGGRWPLFLCAEPGKAVRFSLDGKDLKAWSLSTFFPHEPFSSNATIDLSPQGKRLLLEVDMDEEESSSADSTGPSPSPWTFDLVTEHAERVTPKGPLAMSDCWVSEGEILLAGKPKLIISRERITIREGEI